MAFTFLYDNTYVLPFKVKVNGRKNSQKAMKVDRRRNYGLNTFKVWAQDGDRNKKEETGIQLYRNIESVFSNSAQILQNKKESWNGKCFSCEGSWVMAPPDDVSPFAVVHFIGGTFVGASPQLAYRLFLELLASSGIVIIATPFASGFDHYRIADETLFKFDSCLRVLSRNDQFLNISTLPIFGMGHSLGALTHVLTGSRYGVQRRGNILISYNNREASEAIPALSSTLIPLTQRLGPLLTSLGASKSLQLPLSLALSQLETLNPQLSRDIKPILGQLPSLYEELQKGDGQFVPSPEETDALIKSYYGVKRNLLVSFKDDPLDESPELSQILRKSAQVGPTSQSQLSIRVLPGSHTRPMQQPIPELPPAMAEAFSKGASFLSNFTSSSPLAGLASGIAGNLGLDLNSLDLEALRNGAVQDTEELVGEIVEWMKSADEAQKLLAETLEV